MPFSSYTKVKGTKESGGIQDILGEIISKTHTVCTFFTFYSIH